MADQTFTAVLEVRHSGGRAWHWVAPEFDERPAAQLIEPVLGADVISEIRRAATSFASASASASSSAAVTTRLLRVQPG